jgi:hypothetical protein
MVILLELLLLLLLLKHEHEQGRALQLLIRWTDGRPCGVGAVPSWSTQLCRLNATLVTPRDPRHCSFVSEEFYYLI